MPDQHHHLANKCEDNVNLQGADAYFVATHTACYSCAQQTWVQFQLVIESLVRQEEHPPLKSCLDTLVPW